MRWRKKKRMIRQMLNWNTDVVLAYNVSGLCVVALSRNLKLTTTLDRAITQNPCYVPFFFKIWNTKISIMQVII